MPLGCKPVSGIGPENARIMIVGEALGETEALLEEPFVGQCGQLLDKMLKDAGLSRQECYITNRVKCRPVEGKKNRPPTKQEIKACQDWLYDEIMMVEPKIVFTMGKVALDYFIKVKGPLKDYIGKEINNEHLTVVPFYHPSFLMQHNKAGIQQAVAIFRRYAND
jgi:DNA polymerase